jgi:hypothetical protein
MIGLGCLLPLKSEACAKSRSKHVSIINGDVLRSLLAWVWLSLKDRTQKRAICMIVAGAYVLCGHASLAQLSQPQSALTMSGSRQESGALVNISAAGQQVNGVGRDSSGLLQNYTGFLASIVLSPSLDSDQDGVCDENEADNDDDGIEDGAEILGSSFAPSVPTDPNDRDTDGDNMSDGDEIVVGTSPTNTASVLAVAGTTYGDSGIQVTWTGGGSVTQFLMRCETLLPTGVWETIFTNNPPTTSEASFLDTSATNRTYFYRIGVKRP